MQSGININIVCNIICGSASLFAFPRELFDFPMGLAVWLGQTQPLSIVAKIKRETKNYLITLGAGVACQSNRYLNLMKRQNVHS